MPYEPTPTTIPLPDNPIEITVGYRYGLKISQVVEPNTVLLIDGVEATACALQHMFRPDHDANRWYRFERKRLEGTDHDTIIIHVRTDDPAEK